MTACSVADTPGRASARPGRRWQARAARGAGAPHGVGAGARRVVQAEEGGGAIRQVADHQAVGLAAVLVHDHDVREVVAAARLHQLRQHLRRCAPVSLERRRAIRPGGPAAGGGAAAAAARTCPPRFRRCALGNTSLSSLANCVSRELGLREVVMRMRGSRSPACAYSSSTCVRGTAVLSSSSSTRRRSSRSSLRSSLGSGLPSAPAGRRRVRSPWCASAAAGCAPRPAAPAKARAGRGRHRPAPP